jgi:hypothetical protein
MVYSEEANSKRSTFYSFFKSNSCNTVPVEKENQSIKLANEEGVKYIPIVL